MDAFTMFYDGFVPAADRTTYHAVPSAVYHQWVLRTDAKKQIQESQAQLRTKKLTEDSKKRIKGQSHWKDLSQTDTDKDDLELLHCSPSPTQEVQCLLEILESLIHKLHEEQGHDSSFRTSSHASSGQRNSLHKAAHSLWRWTPIHSPDLQLPKNKMLRADTDAVAFRLKLKHKDSLNCHRLPYQRGKSWIMPTVQPTCGRSCPSTIPSCKVLLALTHWSEATAPL